MVLPSVPATDRCKYQMSAACSVSMIFRLATMTVWDQYHVYRLYREFLISEPCSVLLNLKDCHLESRPAIMASLTNLIMNGNIMLCVDYVDDFWEALGNTNQQLIYNTISEHFEAWAYSTPSPVTRLIVTPMPGPSGLDTPSWGR